MTNREYLESLSDELFVDAIYSVIIPTGKQYTSTRIGMTEWMSKEKGIEWESSQWKWVLLSNKWKGEEE